MTDKQIMIDGVDVSGCISFDKNNEYNICCYDDIREDKIPFANFCVENKNCYYKQLKRKEQECERLKWYLKEIRYDELKALDIEWDEYETHCIDSEYSNIINLVEEALKERSSEDCRYDR